MGLGVDSLKVAWSIIGEDLTQVVLQFLENSKLLKQVNSTLIYLTPKITIPEYIS